ncbi:unnamed protein product [Anisakis simplex]|uniref:ELMO domain-containing protein n=1 Tax=Anisakis simplex TaxID=6269 RepID=A0A0M3JVX6_ANISI|nr:unnamed protein product [Anisakis simplex]
MDLTEVPTTSRLFDVPDLKYFCTRFIAISLFQANIRWRRLPDVVRSLKSWLAEVELAPLMKKQIHAGIGETVREVQRWGEKHVDLFEEEKPRLIGDSRIIRVQRCEHLRMFYGSITWKENKYEIDDSATAKKIITKDCADWPQMQFQFACAYAMLELLTDQAVFDRIRRRAFSKRLSNHCLYDFWLTILSDSIAWEKMFSSDAVAPKQKLSLVFQFAIVNGYFELMNFIWERVSEPQREYIGMNAENKGSEKHEDDVRKLEFLLDNCCPRLRNAMLSMENFKAITDAFAYNQVETFAILLEHLDSEQLRSAREFVDRIYDRKQNEQVRGFRQMIMRRQNTID